MSRIDQLFRDLHQARRKAFMPFVTAGDPDLDFTADGDSRARPPRLRACAKSAFPIAIQSPMGR